MRFLVLALAFGCGGCAGYSFGQTAKTAPRGRIEATFAAGKASNVHDVERRDDLSSYTVDPSMRVGVGGNTDVGLGPFLGLGTELAVKHDFVDREKPYGLALRGGFALAVDHDFSNDVPVIAPVLGPIASWEIVKGVTPYLSLGLRNLWVRSHATSLPPQGATFVERKGYGNGLLQATLGVRFGSRRVAAFVEYGRWMPLWNDPGDFYALTLTHIVSIGMAFCFDARCATPPSSGG